MRKLFQLFGESLKTGNPAVLATIIASSGSAPRGAGARMLVTSKGRLYGTIGGGAMEFNSISTAQMVLHTHNSRVEFYQLAENQVRDLGMVCGGNVHIYFQYFQAYDPLGISLAEMAEEMYRTGERSWLISEIAPGAANVMTVYGDRSGSTGQDVPADVLSRLSAADTRLESGGRVFYCEQLVCAGLVYIFGGGHVAQALVPALAAVRFRCVVLEDREEFCRPELFPGAERTQIIDNSRVADYAAIGADDYVVILTRGHKDDELVLAQALRTPARYIGVIGSRRKSATILANLISMGFTDDDLKRVITPIGLDIGAETPAEIAVSITAQLIQTRSRL